MSFFAMLFCTGAVFYAFCYFTHLWVTKEKKQSILLLLFEIFCVAIVCVTTLWL